MSQKNIEKVCDYLDESLESDSDEFSFVDDSDADPDYSFPCSNKNMLPTPSSSNVEVQAETSGEESFEVSSSNSDNSVPETDDDQWVENWVDIPDFQFNSSDSGIKLDIPDHAKDNPLHSFEMLWTKEITKMIVLSTNNYGIKLGPQTRPHKKYSRNTEFNKVDFDEMYKFFGICLLAGSVTFAVIRDMFSNNPLYYYPIISKTMSGRRFEKILRCFSVEYCDQSTENDPNDPLKKIQPLFNSLLNNFRKAYTPYEALSLDESLLLHRGRLMFRQYMRLLWATIFLEPCINRNRAYHNIICITHRYI
ncbi:piggyBac transposable element-derived protein 4-like [Sipha flava]|uniref:PiggyBac transposable element-derived protein 4-like n=1 Tax=Sipha flava TaxID=143950 RepID=A0A8B8GE80_9HEMI|nr:piggyBac transposable element-derived protein 4-like [Sipha flava]